jgi:hypothetical protein
MRCILENMVHVPLVTEEVTDDAHRQRERLAPFVIPDLLGETAPCACRKSNPNILVVQPAQDRAAKNGPGQFDGARDRRILLQR